MSLRHFINAKYFYTFQLIIRFSLNHIKAILSMSYTRSGNAHIPNNDFANSMKFSYWPYLLSKSSSILIHKSNNIPVPTFRYILYIYTLHRTDITQSHIDKSVVKTHFPYWNAEKKNRFYLFLNNFPIYPSGEHFRYLLWTEITSRFHKTTVKKKKQTHTQ